MNDEQSTINNPARTWTRPHLLDLESLSAAEILAILDTAKSLKEVSTRSIKKVPALRGKVVVNLFFEDSTRTKTSFSLAAQRLSADVLDFSVSTSSVSKGETLRDTARTIEAMGVDVMIVRHKSSGAPHLLSRSVNCAVINAGDGSHEHPTQGLLDLFTIREHLAGKGNLTTDHWRLTTFSGLHVAIVGDIANSRVARSNLHGLIKLGAKVTLIGPSTLVPGDLRKLYPQISISHDLDAVLPTLDVINMLRIQFERLSSSAFPSVREYSRFFGLTKDRLQKAKPELLVLHPGPMNRGLEITTDVADGTHSAILNQVSNGLAVRMAVLYLCVGANALQRRTESSAPAPPN
ncbi:MAG TPA: aspartate carbamoyltransferase catalytic subunit [Phycisphaerae bacterium]|nr:aspartate carbamoyltransferase catalytic subunit [Phycisphaerae bacterium]